MGHPEKNSVNGTIIRNNCTGGKKVDKLMVYTEIRKLRKEGFSERQISRKLGISRTTVSKYLEMDSEEMATWLASTRTRTRKLDKHSVLILGWLREHPDMSSSQIHDWLVFCVI